MPVSYVGLSAGLCDVCFGENFYASSNRLHCSACSTPTAIQLAAADFEWLIASDSPTSSGSGGLRWAAGSPPHDQSNAAACVLVSGELDWLSDFSFDTLRRIGSQIERFGDEYRNDTASLLANSVPLAPPIGRIVDGESFIPLTSSVFRWILGKIESIEANGLPGDGVEPTSKLLAAARESVRVGWLPQSFADARTWPTSSNGVNPFAALDLIRDQLLEAEAAFALAERPAAHSPRWFDREPQIELGIEIEMATA